MKKAVLICKKGMILLAAWGFFGIFYPELCMMEDTCKVVYQTDSGEEEEILIPEGSELYYKLLSAEPGEIKIRSRLLQAICNFLEKDKD